MGRMSCKGSLEEASDSSVWLVAVPTRIFAAARSMSDMGTPGLKYYLLAAELTMVVLTRTHVSYEAVLVICRAAHRCSHVVFRLFCVTVDVDMQTTVGWGSTDVATLILVTGWGGYRKVVSFQ